MIPYAETRAAMPSNIPPSGGSPCTGIDIPNNVAPFGYACIDNDFSMKSNALFTAVTYCHSWLWTRDAELAKRRQLPYLTSTLEFMACWLLEGGDGKLQIRSDCIYEDCGCAGAGTANSTVNPASTLGFLMLALNTTIDMAAALNGTVSSAQVSKWIAMRAKLPLLPLGLADTRCQRNTPSSEQSCSTCPQPTSNASSAPFLQRVLASQQAPYYFCPGRVPIPLYSLWPSLQVGLGSDPALLAISRNTVERWNAWLQGNSFTEAFPAAVRVGYKPTLVVNKLENLLSNWTFANGVFYATTGGIETLGNTAAINDMLCHVDNGGTLRLFPSWPPDEPASFANLRVEGGLLISASLVAGAVANVSLTNDAKDGAATRTVRLLSPWKTQWIAVTCAKSGKRLKVLAEKQNKNIFAFNAPAGGRLVISGEPGPRLKTDDVMDASR